MKFELPTLKDSNENIIDYAFNLRGDLLVCFDSLRPLNNLSVMRDGSSWDEPVLSKDK